MPRRNPENLYLKFRLNVTEPMTAREAFDKFKQAVRTGYVPQGIEIAYMDWSNTKTGGAVLREGRIGGDQWRDLKAFYGALREGSVRVSRAR